MVTLVQNAETLIPLLRGTSIFCFIAASLLMLTIIYLSIRWDVKALARFVKENKPVVHYTASQNSKKTPAALVVEETIPSETMKKLTVLLGDGNTTHCDGWHTTAVPATTWQAIYQQSIALQKEQTNQTLLHPEESTNTEGVVDHD